MSTNNMATLQAHLFDVLQGVKEGKIDVERANAVCAVSQQLINTVKAESDFGHRTGLAVSSSMIEVKTPSPVAIAAAEAARPKPAAIEAPTVERRANGAVIERNGHVTRHTAR